MAVVKKPVHPCDSALPEQARWDDSLYGSDSIFFFFFFSSLDFWFLFCPIIEKLYVDSSDIYARSFLHRTQSMLTFIEQTCVTVLQCWHQVMYVQMGGKDNWHLTQELQAPGFGSLITSLAPAVCFGVLQLRSLVASFMAESDNTVFLSLLSLSLETHLNTNHSWGLIG